MKIAIKLDKRKWGEKKSGFPICVYVSRPKMATVPLRTGYYSKPSHWDATFAEVNRKHPEYLIVNDFLDAVKTRIRKLLRDSEFKAISIDEVPEYLFKKDFTVMYDAIVDHLGQDYKGTHRSAANSFNEYYPKVTFNEVSKNMVERWIMKLEQKGNKPAGIDSYVRSMRAMWNKLNDADNPFRGHRIAIPKKVNRVATLEDLRKLQAAELDYKGTIGGSGRYRDYFLLMYYLGGIDPEVLCRLRYDEHVVRGRVIFNRRKGNSNSSCNNVIPPQAFEILKKYDCAPYLVPMHKAKTYKHFIDTFRSRFRTVCRKLDLSVELRPKSARYTFIDRAQQLLIDERLTAQIVGHQRRTVTSLYTNDFPLEVQDEAHMKVVNLMGPQ